MNKATYYKIGLFTIAGNVLIVALLIVLGAGSVVEKKVHVETYFNESVQGLSEGAPVKYRGVPIGYVEEIGFCDNKYSIRGKDEEEAPYLRYVYVKMSVEPQLFESRTKTRELFVENLRRAGMRLRLAAQGITGLVYIEADYLDPDPDKDLDFPWEPEHLYLPSRPNTLAKVADSLLAILTNIKDIDYRGISKTLEQAIQTMDNLLNTVDRAIVDMNIDSIQQDIRSVVKNVDQLVVDFDMVVKRMHSILEQPQVEEIPVNVQGTIANVEEATQDLKPMLKDLHSRLANTIDHIGKLAADFDKLVKRREIDEVLDKAPEAATTLQQTIRRFDRLLASNQRDIDTIVANIRQISEHLKQLSSNARKYPSHVLFGEPPRPNKR